MKRAALQNIDWGIAVSRFTAEKMAEKGVPRSRIFILSPHVDTRHYRVDAAAGSALRAGVCACRCWLATRPVNVPRKKRRREEVGKSYDEYAADPSIGIPADEVMARLRASYRARQTKSEG